MLSHLECARCRQVHDATVLQNRCECGGTLLARYHVTGDAPGGEPGMWRYRELLPVAGEPVSLGEAETPLLPCRRLSNAWGVEVLLKDDAPLPGGTFKARGAAVGVTRAKELGATSLVMPTAGNAGGAWSLYAARAGTHITVVMPTTSPRVNRFEVEISGGELVNVDGTLTDAGRIARALAEESGAFLCSTFNEPYRLEGKKTAFLEVYDRLGWQLPRTVVVPLGGGVAALAALKAAEEAIAAGWTSCAVPRVVGVQPEDCAPIVRAFDAGADVVEPWPSTPTTVAAGLRVPEPAEGTYVLQRLRETGGVALAVNEQEILDAVRQLATLEGVLACPEGAATVAGAARLELEGPVLLYNTGTGLKYVDEVARR